MILLPPALAPNDDVAFVLQAAAVGALFGAAVAARRRRRNPEFDAWLITARWALLAGAVAAVIGLTKWLGWW